MSVFRSLSFDEVKSVINSKKHYSQRSYDMSGVFIKKINKMKCTRVLSDG